MQRCLPPVLELMFTLVKPLCSVSAQPLVHPLRNDEGGLALESSKPVLDWLLREFPVPGPKAGDRTRTGDVQLGKLDWKPPGSTAPQGFMIASAAHVRCLVRCFGVSSRLSAGEIGARPVAEIAAETVAGRARRPAGR